MKISGESHKRTAVAIKEDSVGGVVYIPGSSGIDLSDNLKKRSKDTKILYNVFNQVQAGTAPSEYEWKDYLSEAENKKREAQKMIQKANYELRRECGDYAKKANFAVNRIIFSKKPKEILSDDQIISNMKKQKLSQFKGRMEDFVLIALRKSLVVSTYNQEVFDSRKAATVFLKNIGKKNISADDERQIKQLMALIREDYDKWNPDKDSSDKKESSGTIMTDYNQQNSQQKVRTNKKDNLPEAKYEHFKMLLYKGILEMFIQYYKRKGEEAEFCYSFLRKPECKEMMSEEDFCNTWQMNLYGELSSDHYDAWMISWFIVAHFMLPTHLNHLKGEIKSYFSYIEGIELRRRQFAFNKRSADEKEESDSGDSALAESMRRKTEKEKKERYKKILEVLNLASEYCGQVSADWNDYYENEEAYAKNIEKYVCYYDSKTKVGIEEQLRTFCNEEAEGSPSGYVGIFYDGKKPILNRNIVRAKMYGTERLLTECLADDRITKEEIKKFYQLTKKKIEKNSSKKRSADDNSRNLEEIFKTGTCENIKEEAKRREYQQKKNRIELVDIRDYSDMINDLMSQLISWCYLRERDRMYFQLGYYYVRLYHGGDAIPADSKLRVLERMDEDTHNKKGIADGAVLYQLAAIYTYELPVYRLDEKRYAVISEKGKAGSQISQGVNAFYKEYSDVATYEAGLSLFESGIEEMEINHFRDYIDHFKYFARRDRSMLELYSTMFGQFFRNDIKLKKNVPVAFQNILARHFVVAALGMDIRHVQRTVKGKERTYEMPLLVFKRDLESEVTVHKFSGNSKEKLDYYNEDFLTRMRKILEYKK